jgi:methylated-DNA-[protein]-cysteine S-methyltransferase
MQIIYTTTMLSPIGTLRLRATDHGLTNVFHENQQSDLASFDWKEDADHPHLAKACLQLEEYFEGKRKTFDVPLAPEGTPFQQEVWMALRDIPYGQTTSYTEIAAQDWKPQSCPRRGSRQR